jgi:hypothetical protein
MVPSNDDDRDSWLSNARILESKADRSQTSKELRDRMEHNFAERLKESSVLHQGHITEKAPTSSPPRKFTPTVHT